MDDVVELGPDAPLARTFAYRGGTIGNRFAMMEAVLILAMIAQHFVLEAENEQPEPFPSITLRPKGGVWLRPEPRFGN